jgi:hypothetical protein
MWSPMCRPVSGKSPLTTVCEVTSSLLLSAAPAVNPGRLRELGVTCVVNAASELPNTPLPSDREVAYYKVEVEDRSNADLLSHMDFVADMIEEVGTHTSWSKSKSKSCYDWRPVSQSVNMSWCQVHSGTCDQMLFCLKVAVFSVRRPLWREVGCVSCQCLVHCQRFNIIYIVHVTCFMYKQYLQGLCQHRLSTADHAKMYTTTAI